MTSKAALRTHGRPVLGLLVDWTVEPFQQTLLRGITDYASRHGEGCIIFEGGSLTSPHEYETQRNFIYSLAGREVVDGLVVLSASLGRYVPPASMCAFCRGYMPLPIVSISMEIGKGVTRLGGAVPGRGRMTRRHGEGRPGLAAKKHKRLKKS